MDPLSIAGSIAGLISLSDAVFRKLFHYVKDFKNAEQDVQDLKAEIAALNGVLHNLRIVAQDLEKDQELNFSSGLDHVNSCLATLYKLDEKLNQVGFSDTSKMRRTMQKLSWPMKAVNIEQFMGDIQQHRNNLSFALTADSMLALMKCLSSQEGLLERLTDIDTRLRNREDIETRIQMDDESRRVLGFFLLVNPHESFSTSLKLRYPTTGFWLTEMETFHIWLHGFNVQLWSSGIPGAGKTILSTLIIQSCMMRATSERAVAFFYCDYKNHASQEVTNILGSLASQLARQNEAGFSKLKAYYRTLHPEHSLEQKPEVYGLVRAIQDISDTFEDVRIVVDGLDECGDNVREVIKALKSLVSEHSSISMSLLSRDEPDIRDELEAPVWEHIEIAAHTKDVEHYVRTEIEVRIDQKILRIKSMDLKAEIISQLVTRAHGMFRWVSCQLDHLCELPTDALRRAALKQLPETLFATYDRILMRIKEPSRPLVRRTLQWLSYASPKLATKELVEVVSFDEFDKCLDPEAYPDIEDILRLCGSLVRRVRGAPELAHFTVQEFLEAIEPKDEKLNMFRLCNTDRLTLARTCIAYLCLPIFNQHPAKRSSHWDVGHPFHTYASIYILDYFRPHYTDPGLVEWMQRLFMPENSLNLTSFMLKHVRGEQYLDGNEDIDEHSDTVFDSICHNDFGSLHTAAMLHIPTICQWLISSDWDVNQFSPAGTPIECAIYGIKYAFGHKRGTMRHLTGQDAQETISLLLDAGAPCDGPTAHAASLSRAVCFEHNGGPTELLVKMLEHGMPIHQDALKQFLSLIGRPMAPQICDRLRNANIEPVVKAQMMSVMEATARSQVPSHSTSNTGNDAFFEAIGFSIKYHRLSDLKSLANDNRFLCDLSQPGKLSTFLHLAAECKAVEIMHQMLDWGWDPLVIDEKGQTAIHKALLARIADESILRRLIASQASGVADKKGRTVWHHAAFLGDVQFLELLLGNDGVNPVHQQQECNTGCTPILQAIVMQHSDWALLLLKSIHTHEVTLKDARILHYAVAAGLDDVVHALQSYGFDMHAIVAQERTALYSMSSHTTYKMFELLCSCGLDVDHQDLLGRSPLLSYLACDERVELTDFGKIKGKHSSTLDFAILTDLITTTSAMMADRANRTAWFYFCTETLTSEILLSRQSKNLSRLIDTLSALVKFGALAGHEALYHTSGVVFLLGECLKTFGGHRKYRLDQHVMPPEVDYRPIERLLELCNPMDTVPFVDHPHLTRLLMWSVLQNRKALIKRLVQLGVDIHQGTGESGGQSAFDLALRSHVDFEVLDILLKHADIARVCTKDESGWFRYFHLCSPDTSQIREKNNIKKLEFILRAGIDIDSRSSDGFALIHAAVLKGSLDAMKILVRFKANVCALDNSGWSVLHLATLHGRIKILQFLQDLIPEVVWKITVPFVGPASGFTSTGDPLEAESYLDCNMLHLAACSIDAGTFKFLHQTGYFDDIDAQTREGATPLHFAVCYKSPKATRWLISKGADVNAKLGPRNGSALHVALTRGQLKNALALIQAGAVFCKDSTGSSPESVVDPGIRAELMEVLPHCGVHIPKYVLDNLARDHRLDSGESLFNAIIDGDLDKCESLIDAGHSVTDALPECGSCDPLIVALVAQQSRIVRLLLSSGASTKGVPCQGLRMMDDFNDCALNIAVRQPIFNSILDELLELDLEQEHGHRNLLHTAAARNPGAIGPILRHMQIHEELLAKSSSRVWNSSRRSDLLASKFKVAVHGATALHVAAGSKQSRAIRKLLAAGAPIDTPDDSGVTPLHVAVGVGCVTSTTTLLQHGAAPCLNDKDHRTPFMIACQTGVIDIIDILARFETDRTHADLSGMTALHLAAIHSNLDAFMYLLDAGWDPYQRDRFSRTPLHYAFPQSHFPSYLYAKGLDLTHLTSGSDSARPLILLNSPSSARSFYRYLSRQSIRCHYIDSVHERWFTQLMVSAMEGDMAGMRIFVQAGADLEVCDPHQGTALIMACRSGRLTSVKFLVRHGAKLECVVNGRIMTAVHAARGHRDVVDWFLMNQYFDQDKLMDVTLSGDGQTMDIRHWSGVRQVQIPLRGAYERPWGVTLEQHARHLRWISKSGWTFMVPLNFDTIAHLTDIPGELVDPQGSL